MERKAKPVAGVTLRDVAEKAGVSQPTASRALNGSSRTPAQHIVDAVRRAADELGYIPNAQAQALVRSSTGLVGLVVHDIADPYFSAIAAGAQDATEAHGHQMMLAATHRSPEAELAAVDTFIARRVEALVLAGSRSTAPDGATGERLTRTLKRFVDNGGRVAVIGQAIEHAGAVVPGNHRGAQDLAEALVAQGGRRFVVLSGPADLTTAADRTAGFVAGLSRGGVCPLAVIPGEFTRDGGYAAALEALGDLTENPEVPACVFAVNDVMAVGAMTALHERGLSVPDQVQVAGFDDIPTLRDHTPGLTTVRLPLRELGARSVELALSSLPGSTTTEQVRGEVVLRASTGG